MINELRTLEKQSAKLRAIRKSHDELLRCTPSDETKQLERRMANDPQYLEAVVDLSSSIAVVKKELRMVAVRKPKKRRK